MLLMGWCLSSSLNIPHIERKRGEGEGREDDREKERREGRDMERGGREEVRRERKERRPSSKMLISFYI